MLGKVIKKKMLYISGYDRDGKFKFSVANGSTIPAGIIAGKGWTLKTEFKEEYQCALCGDYLFQEESDCSCK